MKLPIILSLAAFTFSVSMATIASASPNTDTTQCGEDKEEKKEDKS